MKRDVHRVAVSPTLRRLLLDCQMWCSADCCKANAFELTESAVTRWLRLEHLDRSQEVAEEIGRVRSELQQAVGQIFLAARDLESTWDTEAFKAFWGRLEAAVNSAVEARERATMEMGNVQSQTRPCS